MLETDKRKINMEIYNKLILTIKKYFDAKALCSNFRCGDAGESFKCSDE